MEADLLEGLTDEEIEFLDRVIEKLYKKSQMFAKPHQQV